MSATSVSIQGTNKEILRGNVLLRFNSFPRFFFPVLTKYKKKIDQIFISCSTHSGYRYAEYLGVENIIKSPRRGNFLCQLRLQIHAQPPADLALSPTVTVRLSVSRIYQTISCWDTLPCCRSHTWWWRRRAGWLCSTGWAAARACHTQSLLYAAETAAPLD